MRKLGWSLAAVLAMAFAASIVLAETTINRVTANVPFSFYVDKTELPAGNYEVYQMNDNDLDLVIRNMDTGKSIVVPVLTRDIPKNSRKAELVFTKVNDKSYLTDVLPSVADGYKLTSDKEIHALTAGLPKGAMSGE